ncbi:MAG: saccharopine dehydrogenase NADP-binding domain-containing protein [Desulfobacterales bacterium]|nr:saccharopine dehydrogenase NADP-binding domain-containing protein [Desulfobacterales bacterium]
MKVLIIGAGAQGGPCVSILSRDPDVREIILGDIDLELVNKVKEKVGSPKITTLKIDAGNIQDIERAAQGVDVIITLTLTVFNENIMKAALAVGAHYVDTSFGEPEKMDICASDNILSQIIEGRPIALDDEFKKAGLSAIHGCGGAPGVMNVLTRYYADKLDTIDSIRMRVGRKSMIPSDDVVSAWTPTWSPFRSLWGYAIKPMVFKDGKYKTYPIFSGYEEYRYPKPIDIIPMVLHQHQEQITLPYFIGKGIRYCDFKYTIDKNAGTLIKQGFASNEPVDVKGCKVAPLDVLMKIVRKPVDTFLSETAQTAAQPISILAWAAVELIGKCGEDLVEYKIDWPFFMFDTPEKRLAIFNTFGASNIYVALPAVVGAKMCMRKDTPRGVIASECLDPVLFLKIMGEMNAPLEYSEVCTRKVAI